MHIVHTESSLVMGGQERRVLSESLGMRDRGHRVSVVTPRTGVLYRRASAAGLPVIHHSFRRELLPWSAAKLRTLFRRLAPDVVNTHSSADSWPSALAFAGGPRFGALVRSRHISAAVGPGALHRYLYGQADHVITTGERVRHDLAETGLVELARSTSIPTGVDTGVYRPSREARARTRAELGLQEDTPVVGVVAFLRPDKGHPVLLQAMREVVEAHPEAFLLVAGDGSERLALETAVDRLGLARHVRFLGLREDVPEILPALDVFCLASVRNEGVPQSLLQASATELAVVSTFVGGIPEAVLDGKTGTLVPPGDPSALGRAIRGLLADSGMREAMGRAGRAHVESEFSVQGMLDRTATAYATALEAAARRGNRGARTGS